MNTDFLKIDQGCDGVAMVNVKSIEKIEPPATVLIRRGSHTEHSIPDPRYRVTFSANLRNGRKRSCHGKADAADLASAGLPLPD